MKARQHNNENIHAVSYWKFLVREMQLMQAVPY